MAKVSVIIPVFGVEQYIERCARSLFEQTLDDMEFIFVDDCTKDNSIRVLEKVLQDYPLRIKQVKIVHHQTNRGLSRARETGVSLAASEYIAHCDSDDWVEPDMYRILYKKIKEGGYDIVKCSYFKSFPNKEVIYNVYCDKCNYTHDDIMKYLLSWKGWNSIWTLLVKSDIYKGVEFTDFAMLEDFFVVTQLLTKSHKIGIVNKPFYHYFQNPQSICGNINEEAVIKRADQASRNITLVLALLDESVIRKYKNEVIRLKYEPCNILMKIMTNKKNYTIWSKFALPNLEVINSSYISKKEKIQYMLVQTHLYYMIKKII